MTQTSLKPADGSLRETALKADGATMRAQLTLALGKLKMELIQALGFKMRMIHHKRSTTPMRTTSSDTRVIPVVLISHPVLRVLSASNKRLQTLMDHLWFASRQAQ